MPKHRARLNTSLQPSSKTPGSSEKNRIGSQGLQPTDLPGRKKVGICRVGGGEQERKGFTFPKV